MAVTSIVTTGLLESPSKLLLYGLEPSAAPTTGGGLVTLGLGLTPSRLLLAGMAPGAGGTAPVLDSATALSGTEIELAWTGSADEYRIDGGTATALPDGTSPDTITGLTPNTLYGFEVRLAAAGTWSNLVSAWTDNTGGVGPLPTARIDQGAGKPTRRRRRYTVEVNGEQISVSGPAEAADILKQLRAAAEQTASVQLARSVKAANKPKRKIVQDARRAFDAPEIHFPPELGLSDEIGNTIAEIEAIFSEALRSIEIGALMRRQEQDDDDEAILLLML